jgi:hypothetical protein
MPTDLRRAILDYRAYMGTGERRRRNDADWIQFSGVATVQRLSELRLRLRAAIESECEGGAHRDVADLLAYSPLRPLDCPDESAVDLLTITTAHNGITRQCVWLRLPVMVLDVLDRALARLPVPASARTVDGDGSAKRKKPSAWLPAALLLLKNSNGRMLNCDIAKADGVGVSAGTLSRNEVFKQARATYAPDAPPPGVRDGETGDVDAYTSKPARKK